MGLTPKEKKWLGRGALAALILLFFIGVDMVKSSVVCQLTARRFGATRAKVRRIEFDGYWRVTMDADVPGSNGVVRYSVTPIFTVVYAR